MIKPTASGPVGHIQSVTGLEAKPCFTCRHYNNDRRKLLQFLNARGLKPDENGFYETPIVGDFAGRRSLKLDPRSFGFCLDQTMPTHMNATCEHWDFSRNATDLARIIAR
jgi:ribulose kinase